VARNAVKPPDLSEIRGGVRIYGHFTVPVRLYTGAQINFGDLTPYLTYGAEIWFQSTVCSVDAYKLLEVPSILYVDWLIDDKIPRLTPLID
jgi:hypothetical protein